MRFLKEEHFCLKETAACCCHAASPSGSLDLLASALSLTFAKVFEIRITCCWISLLSLGSAVSHSYVQINRINFPKRFALAQQFLTISGSNPIAAVWGSFSSTFFFLCWSPSSSSPLSSLCCSQARPVQIILFFTSVSRSGVALARQKWQKIPSFKSQPDWLCPFFVNSTL